PNRGGVENEIVFGTGINRGRVDAFRAAVGELALSYHFQTRDIGWVAVPFPADETWDAVAVLHAAAGENPVLVIGTDPVGAAGDRKSAAGADERGLVRPVVFQLQ